MIQIPYLLFYKVPLIPNQVSLIRIRDPPIHGRPLHPDPFKTTKQTIFSLPSKQVKFNQEISSLSHTQIQSFNSNFKLQTPNPPTMESQFNRQPSIKQRLRSSLCLSCCFNGSNGEDEAPASSLLRSSSGWIRDRAKGIPEMVNKMSRNRRLSGDFKYDPMSYALNFDEGYEEDERDGEELQGERFRYRNFSSRLPSSPPVRMENDASVSRQF
ncbi:hypothetical protein LUZ60_008919 [Juncus effusus]|nr:hypothetical protein LUZ60_008919 [Juncus effusus]